MPKKTLAVVAHADDNAIGLGGLEALLAKSGSELITIVTTDQAARKEEEKEANKHLGFKSTHFLQFNDGSFDEHHIQEAVWQILDRIPDLSEVDNILAFDQPGYTSHPDHITTYYVAEQLFKMKRHIKTLTLRSMTEKERKLWLPYFIPIQPQDHIKGLEIDTRPVSSMVNGAIRAHASQYEIDGRKHVIRRQLLNHKEKYRVITK